MLLPMQGHKLLPGVQNVVNSGVGAGAQARGRGDRALDPRYKFGKTTATRRRHEFGAAETILRGAIERDFAGVVGENIDQRGFELSRIAMVKFGLGQFFHVVVHQPGMIEHRLQDQCLASRYRRAMTAMYRARRQMRTCRHIGFIAPRSWRSPKPDAATTATVLPIAPRRDLGGRKQTAKARRK